MLAHLNHHLFEAQTYGLWYVPLMTAYLLGSVPFGLLISRIFLGIDPRQHGSGNIGMTNVMRTSGKWPGLATFVLDFGKGTLAVWLSLYAFKAPEVLALPVGFLVVFGHTRSVFLGFRGGKGVATNFGVWAIIDWRVFLAIAGIWAGLFLWKRISSLSALTGLALLPTWVFLFNGLDDKLYLAALLSIYLILLHRSNIRRLIAGEEGKLKSKSTPKDS